MKQYRKWSLVSLVACIILWTGCDSISMKEVVVSAPQVLSFSPESGSVGSEIVVTGEYLDDVVSATIGGEKVTIFQKVSNERLSLKVTSNAKSGKIVLSNSIGEGVSETDFTIEYPAPVISEAGMPAEVEMGNKLLLSGTHMNVISAVLFTAEGHATGNEADILSQSENEVLVKIPYVESDKAAITFKYFNGTSEVETPAESAPQVIVARYEPNVTTSTFEAAKVGDIVVLNGTYLNKIDKILLGTIECNITLQTESELKFAVPSSETYVDGDNTMALKISYFDGREVHTLTDAFVVKVPFVYFWENKKVYAQGRTAEELSSFFSPETGVVYANADWRTKVDPVSFQKVGQVCSAVNTPSVTKEEYNSVNPYFFFSGNSNGSLQINNPAGSTSQLRNYYWAATGSGDDYRVTGSSGSCYGTPVMTYLYLDPSKSANKELVEKVKNGTLETLDEENFPLDVDAKTCCGIDISKAGASSPSTTWAKDLFTVGTKQLNVSVDAVFFVFYYNEKGSVINVADNIKRVGLLHIKKVDYIPIESGSNPNAPSLSSVTFDIYWQKHDYDYSKVQ